MELNHLRYFFEVAKSGSFTEAARRLHVSQSALSKAVALLEAREGVKLLTRSKSGVALTKLGAEVYAKCEGVFRTLTEIEATCRGQEETCAGPLRVGASDHVGNYWLSPYLLKMREQHPTVTPGLLSGTPHALVEALLAREIEFGLFFSKVNTSGIRYEPLARIPMAVVVSPALADGSLKKVAARVGLIESVRAQYARNPSQELVDVLGADTPVAFECNSQEAQKRLCLARGGVAFLARFMVEKEIESGELTEFPLKKPIAYDLLLARRAGVELSLNARTLLAMLK